MAGARRDAPSPTRVSRGASSSDSVTIDGLVEDSKAAQQGIAGQQMIWGKRTLVMLQMHSTGCPGATIDYAQLDWKMSTGPVGYGGNGNVVNYPGGKTFGTIPAPQSVNNSVSIMADQDLAFLADDLNLPSSSSSLQFFQGVTITLKNHFFTVMTIVLPKSKFNYIDTAGARRHFIFMEVRAHRSLSELNYAIHFWRTKSGLEADFVLGDGEVAIEVFGSKRTECRWRIAQHRPRVQDALIECKRINKRFECRTRRTFCQHRGRQVVRGSRPPAACSPVGDSYFSLSAGVR